MGNFFTPRQKRLLIISSLVFSSLITLNFIFTYSFLTINSTTEEPKYILINKGGDSKYIELGLGTKRMLLKRGTYAIEVNSEEKSTVYSKPLGFLWDDLEVELMSQKDSSYMGKNVFACGNDISAVIFYACGVNPGGIIDSWTASAANLGTDEEESLHGHEEPDTNIIVIPYKGNMLEAKLLKGKLEIRLRNTNGYISNAGAVSISNFGGQLTEKLFSVSRDSDAFAVFDTSSSKILRYKNLEDRDPQKLSVDNKQLDLENLELELVTGKDYTYLFSYLVTHDNHEVEEADLAGLSSAKPNIFVFNNLDGKETKKHKLPSKWQIRHISSGGGNKALFFLSGNLEDEVYVVSENKPPELLELQTETPQESCWKDSDSFYYLTEGGAKIYLYSLSKKASFLVYGRLPDASSVSNLNCVSGNLYFNFESDEDGEIDDYLHYKLNNADHSGARIESVIPSYFDADGVPYKIYASREGVKIEAIEGVAARSVPRNAVQEHANKHLDESGVKVEGLKFIY